MSPVAIFKFEIHYLMSCTPFSSLPFHGKVTTTDSTWVRTSTYNTDKMGFFHFGSNCFSRSGDKLTIKTTTRNGTIVTNTLSYSYGRIDGTLSFPGYQPGGITVRLQGHTTLP
jgi:hypothetical protein